MLSKKQAAMLLSAGLAGCGLFPSSANAEPYGGFTRCNTQTVAINYGPRIEPVVQRIQYAPVYTRRVAVPTLPRVRYVPVSTVQRTMVVDSHYASPAYYGGYPVVYSRRVYSAYGHRGAYYDRGPRHYGRRHQGFYRTRHGRGGGFGFSYYKSRGHYGRRARGFSFHLGSRH